MTCRAHFDQVIAGLTSIGIATEFDPRLVRGFDYYTRTTFEFVADALGGAQNAIGGGGRYDKLAEQLGGKPTSGIGFGSGIERLLLTREAEGVEPRNLVDRALDLFVVDTTARTPRRSWWTSCARPGFATDRAYDNRSMKSQMKAGRQVGRAPRAPGRAPRNSRPARLRLETCEATTSSRRNAEWLEARSPSWSPNY